jgi:hypothetical protein
LTHIARATVVAALDDLRQQAAPGGARVSVLALAKRVGLANTTFRRRFPDITEQLWPGNTMPPDHPPIALRHPRTPRPSCDNETETFRRTSSSQSQPSSA